LETFVLTVQLAILPMMETKQKNNSHLYW